MDFVNELNKHKTRLNVKLTDLCEILHGVPYRTLQSWFREEKLPPKYYQKLIIEKLENYKKSPQE